MTEQEFLEELEKFVRQWHRESKTRAMGEWEAGYNASCESRAEEVTELLKRYKGEE